MAAPTASVRAAVRIRPLGPSEMSSPTVIEQVPGRPTQLIIGGNKEKSFTFDYVFGIASQQESLFLQAVQSQGESVLQGINSTLLAYGQTGSGKTYTMGTGNSGDIGTPESEIGVLPRLFTWLHSELQDRASAEPGYSWKLAVGFLEIYGEDIRDLLSVGGQTRSLPLRETEGAVSVIGAVERTVVEPAEMMAALAEGSLARATGSTLMNTSSSRSHAVFTLNLEQRIPLPSGGCESRLSKWALLDLAGSERIKRTGATGTRMKEGIAINMGLLALGNVISVLGEEEKKRTGAHVPYRDSKLTRLLRDSLGGNSSTLMIACVSPAEANMDESLNTLRYAERARRIKNRPVVNIRAEASIVAELQKEVAALRTRMARPAGVGEGDLPPELMPALYTLLAAAGAPASAGISGLLARIRDIRIDADEAIQLRIGNENLRQEVASLRGEGLCPPSSTSASAAVSSMFDTLGISADEISAALLASAEPLQDGKVESTGRGGWVGRQRSGSGKEGDACEEEMDLDQVEESKAEQGEGEEYGEGEDAHGSTTVSTARKEHASLCVTIQNTVMELDAGLSAKNRLIAALVAKQEELSMMQSRYADSESDASREQHRLKALIADLQGKLDTAVETRAGRMAAEARGEAVCDDDTTRREDVLRQALDAARRKLATSGDNKADASAFIDMKRRTEIELGRLRAEVEGLQKAKVNQVHVLRDEKKRFNALLVQEKKRIADEKRAASVNASEVIKLKAAASVKDVALRRRAAELTAARRTVADMQAQLDVTLHSRVRARVEQVNAGGAGPAPASALSALAREGARSAAVAAVARAVRQQAPLAEKGWKNRPATGHGRLKSPPGSAGVHRSAGLRSPERVVEPDDPAALALQSALDEAVQRVSEREVRVAELERRLSQRDDDVRRLRSLVEARERVLKKKPWEDKTSVDERERDAVVTLDPELIKDIDAFFNVGDGGTGPHAGKQQSGSVGSAPPSDAEGEGGLGGYGAGSDAENVLRELEDRIDNAKAVLEYHDEAILKLAGGDEVIAQQAAHNARSLMDAMGGGGRVDETVAEAGAPSQHSLPLQQDNAVRADQLGSLSLTDLPSAQLAVQALFSMVLALKRQERGAAAAAAVQQAEAAELRAAVQERQAALSTVQLQHSRNVDELKRKFESDMSKYYALFKQSAGGGDNGSGSGGGDLAVTSREVITLVTEAQERLRQQQETVEALRETEREVVRLRNQLKKAGLKDVEAGDVAGHRHGHGRHASHTGIAQSGASHGGVGAAAHLPPARPGTRGSTGAAGAHSRGSSVSVSEWDGEDVGGSGLSEGLLGHGRKAEAGKRGLGGKAPASAKGGSRGSPMKSPQPALVPIKSQQLEFWASVGVRPAPPKQLGRTLSEGAIKITVIPPEPNAYGARSGVVPAPRPSVAGRLGGGPRQGTEDRPPSRPASATATSAHAMSGTPDLNLQPLVTKYLPKAVPVSKTGSTASSASAPTPNPPVPVPGVASQRADPVGSSGKEDEDGDSVDAAASGRVGRAGRYDGGVAGQGAGDDMSSTTGSVGLLVALVKGEKPLPVPVTSVDLTTRDAGGGLLPVCGADSLDEDEASIPRGRGSKHRTSTSSEFVQRSRVSVDQLGQVQGGK